MVCSREQRGSRDAPREQTWTERPRWSQRAPRFVTGSGRGAPQDRGVAAPRSGGYGGSYDSCGGAKRMEKLARRVAVAVSRHAQQDCDGERMEVEDGAAHPGSGAVVGNDNGAISCYGAGEASCQDWAPRRWAPGRRRVAAQTGSRELAVIEARAPEEGRETDRADGRREKVHEGGQDFVTFCADGRGAPWTGGASKGVGRGRSGGSGGRGRGSRHEPQGVRTRESHVRHIRAAVTVQRAARGWLARRLREEMEMEGLRARLSELRTVAAGGAKAAGARAAGKGARAPEPEGELARQLRRELQAEVRRRTSAERQLDEARRALTAVGERRGRGAITRAVAATMTDPEETAARIEVACDCDGLLSAAEVSTQTQGISGGVSVETQTEAQRGEAAVLDGGARLSEMVVGKHLHPAQARAVERAERAAARIEELSAVAEASAARYRAAPTAPAALATAAPARTGGRQVRKEQARRRAAVAGMDTLAWTRAEDEHRRGEVLMRTKEQEERQRWLAMADDEDGHFWHARLADQLQERQRVWLRQQALPQSSRKGAFVGEANALRTFAQAAQAAAITVREATMT